MQTDAIMMAIMHLPLKLYEILYSYMLLPSGQMLVLLSLSRQEYNLASSIINRILLAAMYYVANLCQPEPAVSWPKILCFLVAVYLSSDGERLPYV